MPGVRQRVAGIVAVPLIRRLAFHARRVTGRVDGRFFGRLALGLAVLVVVASLLVTLAEGDKSSVGGFFNSLAGDVYWAVTTVLGAGDASHVTSPAGYVISWLLVLFGVAIVGAATGVLVGFVIDILIKEGQGMGAAGYRDHIVVCGWNATARELVDELLSDDYKRRIVLIDTATKSPAGSGVYFVQGDVTKTEDLERAGIREAAAAVIFPRDGSDEADMRSLVTVLAIETMAPQVRTVAEVNNPAHVDHFHRANLDEVLVSSKLTSHLLARSALYPGLAQIVTDIVSGGEGSELYRVVLPDEYAGTDIDTLSATMRADHKATLLAVARGGRTWVNPPTGFLVEAGDEIVVVAESLGTLAPMEAATG
jgi:voltage-gated potassium channel